MIKPATSFLTKRESFVAYKYPVQIKMSYLFAIAFCKFVSNVSNASSIRGFMRFSFPVENVGVTMDRIRFHCSSSAVDKKELKMGSFILKLCSKESIG